MDAPDVSVYGMLLPALEQSIMAAVLVDENDSVRYFNPAAERLWGYARGEVLGRNMRPLLPKALQAVHGSYMRSNREGGEPRAVGMNRDLLVERKDGRQLWVSFSLSKIDLSGRIHYLAFARDVSAEVARSEQNRLLLLAVNHTERPLFVVDGERRIVQINRAFSELFGYAAGEAVGCLPSELLASPHTDAETLARVRSKAWGTEGFNEEILARSKDGRDMWVKASVNPIFDEDSGQLRNQVIVMSDITEARRIRDFERDVLEALTSNLSFIGLGNFICQRIEAIAPGVLVSMFRVVGRRLRHWAAPSFQASYVAGWEGVEIGEGVAGYGTCAHRGEPVMLADIKAEPLRSAYCGRTPPAGCRACMVYPAKRRDGSVIGVFALYLRQGAPQDAYLRRIADISMYLCALAIEREESRQRLDELVHHDALTGLPNRNSLYRYTNDLLASGVEQEIAFFCIGLVRFKDVNNTLGYRVGDQMLVEIVNRLRSRLSGGAFLARLEGSTFVLVVSECSPARAAQVASLLLQVISEPVGIAGVLLDLSACIGVSHYPDEGCRDRDGLLQNAKSAMDQVKASGGGGCLFFSQGMNELARERLLLGTALRRAIAGTGLRLEYQPQVRLDGGGLHGVEALARWHDPEFGEVPPGRFIALAEEIGEIEAVGQWALREACRQLAVWRGQGVHVPVVSVNLSPRSFCSRALADAVAGLLREHALAGERLTIEITESAAMVLTPEMLETVHCIRALGVGLSVDDFGTGFSSLSNLASLPVTEVKIDRSFIDKCLEESRLRALVTAVIGIGRSLDLTVVAEGVETGEQCELLRRQRCPVVQGYLFARPLRPQDVPPWVERFGRAPAAADAAGRPGTGGMPV
ncbi:oxygen-sensing cyclic-di-GMP phosphodiesterase DosP [Thauera linaloolentis]|uniref:cAMP phosphodiesterase n=1 Tax=Thauera linaloolentis (strain DSM 12138 / JCM 21573 / CCUG 41526 / CIP 105981 / IAM 15112 / NBRC 102519 / 47Lol) TaxID=1123367 RepID=N6Z6L5_THAL4|nr:oxygen-sensing cyclic-di-GMP phosphodiesterase DosP [Thauera linaloolentis]ENO87814.1 cAMP phosphodiesterase [Thauera linaloolentis 47Lol = DSM 12138]MCM8565263.1 oxygen-sensing cyclic-di-GMP phosphodiesterase [Thauera linaloolentis]